MEDALKPFGWTCGPDFWQRYYQDAWVFNLANAVERVSAERDDLARRLSCIELAAYDDDSSALSRILRVQELAQVGVTCLGK